MRSRELILLLFSLLLVDPNLISLIHAQSNATVAEIPDQDIKVLSFENMQYPQIARAANMQGVVVVRVLLDPEGKVTNAQALSGALYLVTDAVQNAKKWRFQPNAQNAAILVYDFQIAGLCPHQIDSSQLILRPPNLALITACGFTVQAH